LSRAHIILAAAVREGWGLIVTEANAMGTLAIGYNVPGLRDSIRHGETGITIIEKTPQRWRSRQFRCLEILIVIPDVVEMHLNSQGNSAGIIL
jgi:glycosyltransferase involved in cell wall biosynthesis